MKFYANANKSKPKDHLIHKKLPQRKIFWLTFYNQCGEATDVRSSELRPK